MGGERRENIVPVEVAIQRVLAYRSQVAMLQFKLDEDLKDLMHLQVPSSHSSPSHSPRPLERPSASANPVPSTNHLVLSSLSSPSHSPRPLEGPSSSSSPSPSLVPSTNISGIKRKELTNCLQYLQPEQPGLSHGSVMLKDQIDNLFCKICQVQCLSAFNLKQHFKGRKHKAKVEELELNRKYGGEKANQLQCCELCKVTCMDETLLKQHFQGKKHKHKLQEAESLKRGEEIPNQPKWCELCKVTCMDETLLNQHFQGKKHKHKLQEAESLKRGEEIPNQSKWCELCKVTCMDETLLKLHFQGKKHKHKLQEAESLKCEPYYNEDLSIPNSPYISGAERQPSLSNGYEPYNSKLSSQDLYMEEANSSGMHGSHYPDKISQLKQKSTVLNHVKPFPKQNSSLDLYEDSAGETSVYNSKRNQRMSSKHGVEGMRIDSVPNHRGHYDGKIESEMHDYANVSPNVIQRSEYFKFKPPNLIHNRFESLDTEERGLSTRMKKEEKFNRKWKGIKERGNQVKLKMHSTNEIKVPKRVRHDLLQQDYVTKAPFTEMQTRKFPSKGSVMEMPSSFSEDETAENSSSQELGASS